MNKNFTICLNMIVKNESHIIEKTLNNLCSKIIFDYWVICDTGSTDNTKEIIQDFFDKKQILGELHTEEWVDFGHNRTIALEKAFNKTDYLLVFDADDKIEGNIIFPKNMFEYDSYMLRLSLNSIIYERQALINNRKKWKYVGVLHEYIQCLESANISRLEGNCYIMAGTFGNRSADTEKYKKDALILEKAYEIAFQKKDPIFNRYSFYCANSYKDANDINNAIKWYKNTLKLDNWNQEKYISCMRLYELHDKKNQIEEGIYYLIESYKYDNTRVEGIYNLIKYYCIQKQDIISYKFYELIQNYYENDYINDNFSKKLFVNEHDYSFFLPYYIIIVCERLKKYDIGLKMFDIIFTKKNVDVGEWWIKNLVFNLQFFIEKNKDISFVCKWREYLSLINKKKYDVDKNLVNKYEFYNVYLVNKYSLKINNVNLHKKKICILIIYSFSKEYLEMKNILLDYYKNFDNEIQFYFVESNENAVNDVELNNNIITVKKEETLLNITYKTMEAIKLINSKHNDLEFIIRTNVSTIIDIYNLQVFLNSIPNKNIYCGGQVYRIDRIDIPGGVTDKSLFGSVFIQGISIIFSKDIIDSLCKNIDNINYKIVDDVTFGLFIKEYHPNIIQSNIPYTYNAKVMFLNDKINETDINDDNIVFYRNKSSNRNNDVLNLKTISYCLSNKYKKNDL